MQLCDSFDHTDQYTSCHTLMHSGETADCDTDSGPDEMPLISTMKPSVLSTSSNIPVSVRNEYNRLSEDIFSMATKSQLY